MEQTKYMIEEGRYSAKQQSKEKPKKLIPMEKVTTQILINYATPSKVRITHEASNKTCHKPFTI